MNPQTFNIAWLFTNELFKRAVNKEFDVSSYPDAQVKEDYWFILNYVDTVLYSDRQYSIDYYFPNLPELHLLTNPTGTKPIGKLTKRRKKFIALVTYYKGLALL